MKKLVALCLLLAMPVFAQPSPPDKDYGRWMEYYYQEQDPAGTGGFIRWLQESQTLEKQPDAVPPTAAFLSILFARYPNQVPAWLEAAPADGKVRGVLARALWLARQPERLKAFTSELPFYAHFTAPNLLALPLTNPTDIDTAWAAFSATGDTAYVQKIIRMLDPRVRPTTDQVLDAITREAAYRSLIEQVQKHPAVLELVRKEANATHMINIKKELQEILAAADSGNQKSQLSNPR